MRGERLAGERSRRGLAATAARLLTVGVTLASGQTHLAVAQSPGPSESDEASRLNDQVVELYQAGRYAEAEPLAQRALAIRERVLGREHPDTLTSVNNLAQLYRRQGRYTEAEQLQRRSLDARERGLGREHPDTLATVNNLARSTWNSTSTLKPSRSSRPRST